jgi:flagellar motor switch/type III secretory pathway protein FliN
MTSRRQKKALQAQLLLKLTAELMRLMLPLGLLRELGEGSHVSQL